VPSSKTGLLTRATVLEELLHLVAWTLSATTGGTVTTALAGAGRTVTLQTDHWLNIVHSPWTQPHQ
jgi:hypothetical protein